MSHEPVEASLRWQGKICPLGDLGPMGRPYACNVPCDKIS